MKKSTLLILLLALATIILLSIGLLRRQSTPATEDVRIYVPSGSSFSALADTLEAHNLLASRGIFASASKLRGLDKHVKSGSYLIHPHTGLIPLIQKLYAGNQDAIRITINRHRTVEQLCEFLGSKLELSADTLLALMLTDTVCARYGETPQTIIGMFPQNTYEYYWNISPNKLLNKMHQESLRFWEKREGKLAQLHLTRQQVITLASIVEEETNANDEKADIASVYLNRLHINMPLQADPTVKFAIGDFSIQRIKAYMLLTDSPYNTYMHAGLPPGPICIPSAASIDAVLQNKHTNYLYFCAKEDFSGHHNFATTLAQHQANAARFHAALNQRNIK